MKHIHFFFFNLLLLLIIAGVQLFSSGYITGSIILFFIISVFVGFLIGYRLKCIKRDKTIHNQKLKIQEQLEKIDDLRQAVQ